MKTNAFTSQWSKQFGAAVKKAAGKDGRLSLDEAKALARKTGAQALFADNALNYLAKKGQKSVSVARLLSAASAYVEVNARKAAGNNDVISNVEAKKLPQDLKAEFQYLAGKDLGALPPGGKLDDKKLMALATQYVVDKAGGGWNPDAGKLWPSLDSGEEGLYAQWLSGDQATRVAAFLSTYGATPDGQPFAFDAKKQALVAVSTSFDEAVTYFAVQNRADGKLTYLDKVEMVDVAWGMEEADFKKHFPKLDKDLAGGDDVQAALLDGAKALPTPDA